MSQTVIGDRGVLEMKSSNLSALGNLGKTGIGHFRSSKVEPKELGRYTAKLLGLLVTKLLTNIRGVHIQGICILGDRHGENAQVFQAGKSLGVGKG